MVVLSADRSAAANGVQHLRVQARGKEPRGSRGRAGPDAERDELRGGSATHDECLQVLLAVFGLLFSYVLMFLS